MPDVMGVSAGFPDDTMPYLHHHVVSGWDTGTVCWPCTCQERCCRCPV